MVIPHHTKLHSQPSGSSKSILAAISRMRECTRSVTSSPFPHATLSTSAISSSLPRMSTCCPVAGPPLGSLSRGTGVCLYSRATTRTPAGLSRLLRQPAWGMRPSEMRGTVTSPSGSIWMPESTPCSALASTVFIRHSNVPSTFSGAVVLPALLAPVAAQAPPDCDAAASEAASQLPWAFPAASGLALAADAAAGSVPLLLLPGSTSMMPSAVMSHPAGST
mmetsp:Transcript_15268/g.38072  ORF Transcript_15268/g.38072 Transcript_15268/m.38072 type:complete len:221 (-) Transcript_15268:850-1512(-)